MDFSNELITDLEFESLGHSPDELMSYSKAEWSSKRSQGSGKEAMLSKAKSTHTEGLENVDICTSAFFSW